VKNFTEWLADHVVSNADFTQTFGHLVAGDVGRAALVETRGRSLSPSFFVAYAGVRREALPPASSIGSFGDFDLDGLLGGYVPFSDADSLGITIPIDKTITNWFVKKRGLVLGTRFVFNGICTTILLPIVTWLVAMHGWRSTCLIWACVVFVGLPLISDNRQDPRLTQRPARSPGLRCR
jgi:hypothetical protein